MKNNMLTIVLFLLCPFDHLVLPFNVVRLLVKSKNDKH